MMQQITQPDWVSVKSETRERIRRALGVPKTGSAIVESDQFGKSRVISDGCTHADLQSITPQKMMDYLDGGYTSDDTIHTLFVKVVNKVEGKVEEATEATTTPDTTPKTDDKTVKKCEFCEFQSASKFGMRMHVGKAHKSR